MSITPMELLRKAFNFEFNHNQLTDFDVVLMVYSENQKLSAENEILKQQKDPQAKQSRCDCYPQSIDGKWVGGHGF